MDNPSTSVLVGVCTAQRPKMLKACLESLASQVVPENVALCLVVVDNEPEPNNRAAVEAMAADFPFPLAYEHEPRRGIPQARNRVKVSRAVVSVFASVLNMLEALLVLPFARKHSRRRLKNSITKFVKLPATIAAVCGFRYDRYGKISGE